MTNNCTPQVTTSRSVLEKKMIKHKYCFIIVVPYTIEKIKTTEGNKRYSTIDMYGDPYPDYPNINNNISNSKSNDTKYPEKKNSDCILKLVNINFNLF